MTDRRDFLKRLASIPLLAPLLPNISEPVLPNETATAHDVKPYCSVSPDPRCLKGTLDGFEIHVEEITWTQNDLWASRYWHRDPLRHVGFVEFGFCGIMVCGYHEARKRFTNASKLPFNIDDKGNLFSGSCYLDSIEAHPTDSVIKFSARSSKTLLEQSA